MNNNKRHTAIPDRGELRGFVGEVHISYRDPAELIEKYGPILKPRKKVTK